MNLNGHELDFTRRRYGGREGTTYTWVSLKFDSSMVDATKLSQSDLADGYVDLGDPWPCINPPHKEVLRSIEGFYDRYGPDHKGFGMNWAIYPNIGDSTEKIREHATIWVDDCEKAKRFSDSATERFGAKHEAYLCPMLWSERKDHFVEVSKGVYVRKDEPRAIQLAEQMEVEPCQ